MKTYKNKWTKWNIYWKREGASYIYIYIYISPEAWALVQRILCFVVQGYLVKWERLTWEVAEGLSVAALRDREEVGMVVAVSDCTEKASIGEARRMISGNENNNMKMWIVLNLIVFVMLSITIFSHWNWCHPLQCVAMIWCLYPTYVTPQPQVSSYLDSPPREDHNVFFFFQISILIMEVLNGDKLILKNKILKLISKYIRSFSD